MSARPKLQLVTEPPKPPKPTPAPPQLELTGAPVFGDPAWIRQRGPLKPRRYRFPKRKPRNFYTAIWQRIEGEWTKLHCKVCKSPHWRILESDEIFVRLCCMGGHEGRCLLGYAVRKPEE